MSTNHPPTPPPKVQHQATEAELIEADLHNNINKAQNAWRAQENAALRSQMHLQNLPGGPY